MRACLALTLSLSIIIASSAFGAEFCTGGFLPSPSLHHPKNSQIFGAASNDGPSALPRFDDRFLPFSLQREKPSNRVSDQADAKEHGLPPSSKPNADKAEQLKKALLPKPAPSLVRQQALDELFKRLEIASDEDEAKGIALLIEHLWLRSGSDTADLLMSRAGAAMDAKDFPLALALLDRIIDLCPDWVAPLNQRATVRFLTHDLDAAMIDLNRIFKLEPRHFDALNGLALILQETGYDKRALEVLRHSLAVYPHQPEIEKRAKQLTLEVEGRDI